MSFVEGGGGFLCNGSNPSQYASFSDGSLSWPGGIARTRLQQRNASNNGWTDYTGTGVPASTRFFWTTSGSNVPTDALRFRRTQSGSTVTVDFGASFVSIFIDSGGLTAILPTPNTSPNNASGSADTNRPITLWEVLAYPADSANAARAKLARHCIAAYFNALVSPSTYPVTAGQAIHMWRDVVTSGGYCPGAVCTGASYWDAVEVVSYLQSTYSTPDPLP